MNGGGPESGGPESGGLERGGLERGAPESGGPESGGPEPGASERGALEPEAAWLRLSPRSLAVRPVIDLIRLLPFLLGLLYLRSRGGSGNYWGLGFAVLAVVTSIVRWLTTRYRITDERVYVRRGLLNQKVLSVARDRVRTVDLSAHVLYRMLGLRRVSIGTGRNDRREGESFRLDALTLPDAEKLRTMLLAAQFASSTVKSAAATSVVGEAVGREPVTLNAVALDAVALDAVALDAVALDAVASDVVVPDAVALDAAVVPDAVALDAAVAPDAVARDAVARDAVAPDAVARDAVAPDAVAPDAATPRAVATQAAPAEAEIVRLRPAWIRFAPLTLTGLVVVGVVFGFAVQFNDAAHVNLAAIGPVHRLSIEFGSLPLGQQIVAAVLLVTFFLVLISTAGYIAVFWNFSLVRQGDDTLRVTRGLLSTRATTIDMRRLRGVEISEPLLLRAAGGARCIAITTGLRVGRGAERGGSLLLPPAPRPVAHAVAADVLGLPAELCAGALIRHGPRARRRRYTRALAGSAILVAAVAALCQAAHWPAWIWLSSLAALPLAAALAADRYRSLGHRLTVGRLVTCTGSLVRRRSILSTDGIIGWRIHQSWFQRRQGLVTLTATTAAGRQHYEARDVPEAEAVAVAASATEDLVSPFLCAVRDDWTRIDPGAG